MGLIPLGLIATKIQLVPDGTLLLHLIIIVLMVFLLSRTLFKPINRILEEREKRGEGLRGETAKLIGSVEESFRSYEQKLRAARAEGYSMLEQERAAAIRAREVQLAAAKTEVSEQVSREKQEIARQAESARADLLTEAKRLAVQISSQILGRPVSS